MTPKPQNPAAADLSAAASAAADLPAAASAATDLSAAATAAKLEREQIGLLKAMGYRNAAIAWHCLKSVIVIVVIGIAIGSVAGTWLVISTNETE